MMLKRIAARMVRRQLMRRLTASRSARAAGVAGAVAVTGAALAIVKRRRARPRPRIELLSVNGPATTPIEELTRDELYEMARLRDIRGRSSMSKSELREALASK